MDSNDLIQAYLDDLARRVGRRGTRARETVDEVHDHLLSSAEALVANGATPVAASQSAVAQLGPADVLARAIRQQLVGPATRITQAAGMLGLFAGAALAMCLGGSLYLLNATGARPNAAHALQLGAVVANLGLALFLAGLVMRAAPLSMRAAALVGVAVPQLVTAWGMARFLVPDPLTTTWIVIALSVIQLAALMVSVRPWSRGGFGPVWSRIAILVAAFGMLPLPVWLGIATQSILILATARLAFQMWGESFVHAAATVRI